MGRCPELDNQLRYQVELGAILRPTGGACCQCFEQWQRNNADAFMESEGEMLQTPMIAKTRATYESLRLNR